MKKINYRTNNIKIIVTILLSIMLLVLYYAIFSFSEQDGVESGSLSQMLTKLGVEWWNDLTRRHWTENFMLELTEYFEHPIRKLAHFSEYAVMGALTSSILFCWWEKACRNIGLSILWVAVSASLDEFHQYFVPGRWGSPADVLLDTCGGVFGTMIVFLVMRHHSRKIVFRDKKSC